MNGNLPLPSKMGYKLDAGAKSMAIKDAVDLTGMGKLKGCRPNYQQINIKLILAKRVK